MGKIAIKPEREYLREITEKLMKGEYAIPAFQRDFVWKPNQVLDLFDSISKGYPIGSIILWRPTKDEVPMAKDVISDEIKKDVNSEYFILDGRQRTTAFLGCIYEWEGKPEIFHLFYNPEQDTFVYKSQRKTSATIYAVSDVFDTYKMLGLLQQIDQSFPDKEKARLFIDRVKQLNTVLQQYEIGEILIDNCTLEESSTVFSRINSKGTDISKVAMLQAQTYKDKNSVLLADTINSIINRLSDYGFGDMKTDDVLNCCYRYIDRNFYDNKVMEALVKADLYKIMPKLEQDITKAVSFLHDKCGVINYRLLPYNRQLIAIAAFFKEKKAPTEDELKELEKWFFYTTYQQTFLNGSLGNTRSVFRRFDEYLQGKTDTLIDYRQIDIDSHLDFKFSTSSAQSNYISLCQVLSRRANNPEESLEYCGEFRFNGNKPAGSFLLLMSTDRDTIKTILSTHTASAPLNSFLLDDMMLDCLKEGKISLFLHLRKRQIVEMSKANLQRLGLTFSEDNLSEPSSTETSVDALLSEFSTLSVVERHELCSLLVEGAEKGSTLYQIEKNSDSTFTIRYESFDRPYKLNDSSVSKLLRAISDMYCNGENPMEYYGWKLTVCEALPLC